MKAAEADKKVSKIQEIVYEVRVGEVMTKDVIAVTPQTQISKLKEVLSQNKIAGAPVVEGRKVVGMVSLNDFIRWLAEREDDCPIGTRMVRAVKTLYGDEPVIHAVSKFEVSSFGRYPVIERETGNLIGILTKGDIVRGLLRKLEIDYHEEEIHRYRASHLFEDVLAPRKTLLFEYDVPGQDFKRGGESSGQLKQTLRRLGLHPLVVRRVAIASYEAEMNLIIFTNGGKIAAEVRPDQVTISAEDSGPGIADIEKARQPGYSTAPERVRELGFGAGMGLNNIEKCADEMEITSALGKGTDVRFSIRIKEGNEAKRR